MNERENYLRNARFQNPKYIPVNIAINGSTFELYKSDLDDVLIRYPEFFPNFKKGSIDYNNLTFPAACRKNEKFTDSWGCTWCSSQNGIEGVVINAPLEDWNSFANYKIPNPETQADRSIRDWDLEAKWIKSSYEKKQLTSGGLSHGFLFLRLQYLRGFENFMCDMALDEPLLQELIDKIDEHNLYIINRYLDLGVDIMEIPEDLGMQTSLVISPDMFRKWILPSYNKLIVPCKKKNTLVALHSDGYIMDIADDLVNSGIDIINPQDLCNGIDNIAKTLKGRTCIRLDIDRTKIIPYGTRSEIFELIEEEVKKLGSPQGGLEFIAGIYPPTSPDNLNYLCEALKKYRTYWFE